ncbi:MAG: ABC transporter permease, partial [Chthoniobacteraceae bacterium]
MSAFVIIARSVAFYWRTHLGVLLGTALAAMVLVGSLLVGDSVKATLRHQAELRVGKVESALTAGDRFFRGDLAGETGADAAPVLLLRGSVALPDGSARINSVQLIGADDRFWSLAPQSAGALKGEEFALNERAAAQLGVRAGDTVVLRVEKPGVFSRDAPLSGDEGEVVAIRAKVQRIVPDAEFGRFSLAAGQVPPFTVFVPLGFLHERLGFAGKANLILSREPLQTLSDSVRAKWNLADAGLQLRALPNEAGWELRSPGVFLDSTIVAAVPRGLDALTYLVNELRAGAKATPYSMVTAVDAPASGFLPAELSDDEIVITQWLADDLGVRLNGKIAVKYYVMGERRQLVEQSRDFEVIQILPMTEPSLNSSWMPDFPGLTDKENCRDWKPGFVIDSTKIRDQDEAYWKEHRGTPKAFVNLRVGQQMWSNRWGGVTSIRYPAAKSDTALASDIRSALKLEMLGFQFTPLRAQALAATDAPVDFGQLFVSFSFFLIAAAAVLTGLLFVFTLEQRSAEAGTLLALGLPPRMVRRLMLGEGALLAVLGTLLGCVGAVFYTKLVLRGLATVWRGAVGTSEFVFDANVVSLAGGALGSVVVAMIAMWWAGRRQMRHGAAELLAGEVGIARDAQQTKARRPYLSFVFA